ncbi:hypothetical protein CEP54_015380 [Fusarium duplospermum]|uniref:Uncharacterized protein n=1 Tax=Fusarium duplospermum TaxID=1325734 RepID=A0A428NPH6_9HYPO|nr:hypothetical protein CEP54_015380 [Fusarium duplospermum]
MCLYFPRRRGTKKEEQPDGASEAPRPIRLQNKPKEMNTQEPLPTAPQPTKEAVSAKAKQPYQARWNRPASTDKESPENEPNFDDERRKSSEDRRPAQTATTSPNTGAINMQNQTLQNTINMQVQQMAATDTAAETQYHKTPEQEHKPVQIARKSTPPPRNYVIGFTRPWEHYDREAARVRAARVAEHNDSNTYSSSSYNYRPSSSGGGGGGGGGGYSGGDSGGFSGGGGSSDW